VDVLPVKATARHNERVCHWIKNSANVDRNVVEIDNGAGGHNILIDIDAEGCLGHCTTASDAELLE
jgi:hypothetical protein